MRSEVSSTIASRHFRGATIGYEVNDGDFDHDKWQHVNSKTPYCFKTSI